MADQLNAAGYDAVHVAAIGLGGASDEEVLAEATTDARVIVSADTDFGDLLSAEGRGAPSVVLLRGRAAPRQRMELLLAALDVYRTELAGGAIVVIRRSGDARVRRLPVG